MNGSFDLLRVDIFEDEEVYGFLLFSFCIFFKDKNPEVRSFLSIYSPGENGELIVDLFFFHLSRTKFFFYIIKKINSIRRKNG